MKTLILNLDRCTTDSEREFVLKLGRCVVGNITSGSPCGELCGIHRKKFLVVRGTSVMYFKTTIKTPLSTLKLDPRGEHCGWLRVTDKCGMPWLVTAVHNDMLESNGSIIPTYHQLDTDWATSHVGVDLETTFKTVNKV